MKTAIQAVTQAGTTTRPSAAMPRPAISDAAMTWLPAPSEVKQIERQRQPEQRASDDVADHQPFRHLAARAADMGDRLGAGELHRAEVGDDHRQRPSRQIGDGDMAIEDHRHEQRGDDVGGGEEGRELAARDQLGVAQRAAAVVGRSREVTPSDSPSGRRAEIIRL